jgi:hypothetical protein
MIIPLHCQPCLKLSKALPPATMVERLSPQNVFIVLKAKTDMQLQILFWLNAKVLTGEHSSL